MSPKKIDIVLPVYNEEAGIEMFNAALLRVTSLLAGQYTFRLIYVLDRSSDASFSALKRISQQHRNITIIHLSRRFGHQMSLVAGIDHCTGDAAIMMDCDLQHPPELLPGLLARFEEGYDIVHTIRTYSGTIPWRKRVLSRVFYRLQNALSPVELRDGAADFRLISRKVINVFQKDIREHGQFLRALFQWVGFASTEVHFVSAPRAAGVTKYDMKRLLGFFVDGMLSFSKVPLRMASALGFVFSTLGLLYLVYLIVSFFVSGNFPPGYTSLIGVVLLIGGLQLSVLGVIGEYIGTIFDEVKARPLYVVDEILNGD
jgi:glycosyltransferase involved in cell wall biosynthesis